MTTGPEPAPPTSPADVLAEAKAYEEAIQVRADCDSVLEQAKIAMSIATARNRQANVKLGGILVFLLWEFLNVLWSIPNDVGIP